MGATVGPMRTLAVKRRLDSSDRSAIAALLGRAEQADGHEPLSDQQRLDLGRGRGDGFAAIVVSEDDTAVGLAVVSQGNQSSTIELVIDPTERAEFASVGAALLDAAVGVVRSDGGGQVHWWVFDPGIEHDELAGRFGLTVGRELLQMRRPLPTGLPFDVSTRPFVPDVDDAAWVEVNNRAFAAHPEQGGWTVETLRRRRAEPWFDPAGFLLHERDGRLAGFCWTKLHAELDPPLGEIYVIGVDPDFQGLGLGRQLTLAGLDSIHRRGVDAGMLYVDAANTAAHTMYERLGFTVSRTDRAYTGTV
jgi:mycothiol synthase